MTNLVIGVCYTPSSNQVVRRRVVRSAVQDGAIAAGTFKFVIMPLTMGFTAPTYSKTHMAFEVAYRLVVP